MLEMLEILTVIKRNNIFLIIQFQPNNTFMCVILQVHPGHGDIMLFVFTIGCSKTRIFIFNYFYQACLYCAVKSDIFTSIFMFN